jgi:DNA-binding beta-propeller fold protein YncE
MIAKHKIVVLFSAVFVTLLLFTSCDGDISGLSLLEPTGGEQVSLPVSLLWTKVEDASGYAVEVDTTTSFDSPVVSVEVSDTAYTIPNLDKLKYYWQVFALDEDDRMNDFSDLDSFVVSGASYPRNLLTKVQVLEDPQSLDITPNGSEIWVNHWGQYDTVVYVISTLNNQVTHTIPVTNVGDNELRITSDGNFAYYCGVWNMDSAGILEISTTSYTQSRILGYLEGEDPPVKHGPAGYGIALTQNNDYIYAANLGNADDNGCVTRFDVSSGTMVDSINLPWIFDVDLNHAETELYAVSQDADVLYEIDPVTMTVSRQLSVGNGPEIILITPDDEYAFISHLNDDVYVVELSSLTKVTQFDPDIGEFGMTLTPDEKYLFLCDCGSDYIGVYDVEDPTNPVMIEKLEFEDAGSFTELVFNVDGSRAYVVESHGYIYVLEK